MAIAIAFKDPISFNPKKTGKILIAKLYMQSLQLWKNTFYHTQTYKNFSKNISNVSQLFT